ncbi:MAG: hypothetical protein P9M08_12140 [Candidatus Erginobacter occultus]|nr:hypothetical protein [Candidatus Erginobacter occultus]
MKVTQEQLSREEQAWREVGHTTIRRKSARVLSGCFLAVIFAVPLYQLAAEYLEARRTGQTWRPQILELARRIPDVLAPIRDGGLRPANIVRANRNLLREINDFEDRLNDASLLGQYIRPRVQEWFSGWPGVGNEQAYVGRDGWLFYRPGLDYLTGPGFLDPRQLRRRAGGGDEWHAPPQPDPRPAIIDFNDQLRERGIGLIVVPVPVKPSIHPEKFSARYEGTRRQEEIPLQNASYSRLMADLAAAGVTVFDPSELLAARADRPRFLATDTHWRPEAMEAVAVRLAARIADVLGAPGPGDGGLRRRPLELAGLGDIALMLDLPKGQTRFPPESVTIRQVLTADGQFWRASKEAEVLVLGDSFSNNYSLEPMGWGESAGLVEQLSYFLHAPVDRLVRNDSGAWATRAMLARELARGHDRLAGKRVVVWQFAARELVVGDWRIIPLRPGEPPPARFVVPQPGRPLTVNGTVREAAPVPRPGTVPYRDHVTAVHLVDLPENGEAVVYMFGMEDNEWTRAARLRPGEEITVRLVPWAEVADRYGGINRGELSDLELQLQEPCWGEWVD